MKKIKSDPPIEPDAIDFGSLQDTLHTLQEGIAVLDKKGIVVFINEAAKNIFERRLGKFPDTGNRYIDYVHPTRQDVTRKYIRNAFTGKGFDFTLRYPQEGKDTWFRLGYYPITGSKGSIQYVCVKAQEITEKVQLKKKLGHRQKKEKDRLINAVLQAQEQERLTIGHELHDNINQILATVKLYLEVCMTQEETNKSLLQKAIQRTSFAIDEIRRISHNLSSPELSCASLTVLMQELCDSLASTQHIGIHFLTYGVSDKEVPLDVKTTLYRVTQQQLANILKHAKASSVEIMLVGGYRSIALRIVDNGQGVDLNAARQGVGLISMRSRIEALQGSFHIESSPGKGFALTAEIPLV